MRDDKWQIWGQMNKNYRNRQVISVLKKKKKSFIPSAKFETVST